MQKSLPPVWLVKCLKALRSFIGLIHRKLTPSPVLTLEALAGIVVNKSLGVAVELEIADHLANGPKTLEALSKASGTNQESLQRLLRTLVGIGFFSIGRSGEYCNNAASERLCADHPESMRDFVLFFTSSWTWNLFEHAQFAVRTGQSAVIQAHGSSLFDFLQENPDIGTRFDCAMAASSRVNAAIVAKLVDFSAANRICDIGGGTATNLCEILRQNANLDGVLFETPSVAERAASKVKTLGIENRVLIESGDFFKKVPGSCDVYLLQAVLHDWDDDECICILSRIREASPAARVLVVESVRPEHNGYDYTKLVDVWMLFAVGRGRERSVNEFTELFRRSGYYPCRWTPLPSLFEVIELIPNWG